MKADVIDNFATAAGAAIALIALFVAIAAWRAARTAARAAVKSAEADERLSLIETMRLHAELEPKWKIGVEFPGIRRPTPARVVAKLVGPTRLTSPCRVVAEVVYDRAPKRFRQRLNHLTSGPPAWIEWAAAPNGEPEPVYVWPEVRVGDELQMDLAAIPRPLPDEPFEEYESLSLVLSAKLPPFESWRVVEKLSVPGGPLGFGPKRRKANRE